ncbi:hypothetical protein AB9X29_003746 [Vibrio vulnificus]
MTENFDAAIETLKMYFVHVENIQKDHWVVICQRGGSLYFMDSTRLHLTTFISDRLLFNSLDDVNNALKKEINDAPAMKRKVVCIQPNRTRTFSSTSAFISRPPIHSISA